MCDIGALRSARDEDRHTSTVDAAATFERWATEPMTEREIALEAGWDGIDE